MLNSEKAEADEWNVKDIVLIEFMSERICFKPINFDEGPDVVLEGLTNNNLILLCKKHWIIYFWLVAAGNQ